MNGSKAYVYGADKATHFLTFVSTRVKERNGKIYKRLSCVLIPSDADGVEIIDQSEVAFDNKDLASRIGLYQIVFEDVEIEPSWVVGNIGYGKEYITHLQGMMEYSKVKRVSKRYRLKFTNPIDFLRTKCRCHRQLYIF